MVKIIRPADHEEWLRYRASGIGSSEVGTVLGLNPYESVYELWMRKTGKIPPKPENTAMRMGHYLEPIVAQLYADTTGASIISESEGDWLAIDEIKPYLRVSPDRLYYPTTGNKTDENRGILECKTTQKDITLESIPPYWYAQLQYQLTVMQLDHGALAWLSNGREFGHQEYDRNDNYCRYMLDRLEEFWRKNIVEGIEPEPTTPEAMAIKFPHSEEGKTIEADAEALSAYNELAYIKSQIKTLTEEKDKLEGAIKMTMQDAEILTSGGKTLATYKTAKDSRKFDEKAFRIAHPDLHSQYVQTVAGSRRFLTK